MTTQTQINKKSIPVELTLEELDFLSRAALERWLDKKSHSDLTNRDRQYKIFQLLCHKYDKLKKAQS